MKYRDSGMPNEEMWDTFFTPIEIINKMNINNQIKILIDIGCGYWKYEKTLRGPSMEIRPRPEMIINWATKILDMKPY